ncbi:MAG: SH3 domain-containing protein [Marinilabiliaceae bacterium]|nr:SH3 domain-containing protein [Marinilabiliaceae bacterium]
MKLLNMMLTLMVLSLLTTSCGSGKSGETDTAVCIWNKVSLRTEPNESSKWITAINLGEKVTYLNESATDSSGKKPVEYYKVGLQDGKEGWVRADFIVLNSQPAVLIYSAPLYNRPDLLTKSDKNFLPMDIVAVKNGDHEGWIEVTGKRNEGKWIDKGWIKPENLSYVDVDMAVAVFAKAAIDEKNDEKKLTMLREIANNSDLSNSAFMDHIYEMISYLDGGEEEYYEAETEDETAVVASESDSSEVYVVD